MIAEIFSGLCNGLGSAIGAFIATKYVLTHMEDGIERTKQSRFLQKVKEAWEVLWN